jgi:hypothetical protein
MGTFATSISIEGPDVDVDVDHSLCIDKSDKLVM